MTKSDEQMWALAQKYCAQENEIWDETTAANRRRFLREARATLAKIKGGEDERH